MAQFRNITDDVLWVVTERGMEKVEPDAVLTVSDEFAASRYWQTGETGEAAMWEAFVATGKKKSVPADPSADVPSTN